MVLLIDTNVIIDYLSGREPQYENAEKLINYCGRFEIKCYIAFHSVSIIWYNLRKNFSTKERRNLLLSVTNFFTVAGASHNAVVRAILDENFPDFEDCLQEKCALEVGADYIVTNNVKDFSASQIPAVTPAEMIDIINN